MGNDGVLRSEQEVRAALAATKPLVLQSAKEVIRHVLNKTGTEYILQLNRRRKGFETDVIGDDAQKTFSTIYSKGAWVHGDDKESKSGSGSEAAVTEGLVDRVGRAMHHLNCRSLLDVGCGDWNWMKRQAPEFDYTGIDIVPEVIAQNQRYQRSNIRFAECNAIVDVPPAADFALCREVLFHLSFADAMAVVRNVSKVAKYLCATTDADILYNSDVRTGDFRPINLMRAPFSFPTPVCLILDDGAKAGRFLAVWATKDLSRTR